MNKDGVFHGQLMFANPRGRIPAPDQRTGLAPGATAPGKCKIIRNTAEIITGP